MEIKFMDIWLKQPNQNYHKFFLSMKITILLLLTCVMNTIANNSYSQTAKVTLNLKNASVEEVLNEIEKKSDYYFLLNQKQVDINRRVDVVVENSPIKDVLARIFKNEDVNYLVYDRQIILTSKEKTFSPEMQQQKKISGTITDATTGETIIGANVRVEGTTIATVTDVNGKFSLNIPKPDAIMVVSYMGYNSQRVTWNGQTVLGIKLVPDITKLEAIVVVGYGTQKQKNITGAVASYNASDIQERPVTRVDQALVGQMAGVQVKQTTGIPGKAFSIEVRGAGSISAGNEPLYVIDGFPLASSSPNGSGSFATGNPLDNINPNDIESIQVLKDAAFAAIYGSRAANGVVIITTKKGKTGKPQLSLNVFTGFSEASRKLGMLNAGGFIERATEMINAAWVTSGTGRTASQTTEQRRQILGLAPGLVNTNLMLDDRWAMSGHPGLQFIDWQDEAFKKGLTENYQLSASGANEIVKYYVSGNYVKQDGIVNNMNYTAYSARANVEVKAFKNLTLGVNLAPSFSIANDPGLEGKGNILHWLVSMSPVQEELPGNVNVGNYNAYKWYSATTQFNSPIARIENTIGETRRFRSISSVYADYLIMKGLVFKSTVNLDNTDNNYKSYLNYNFTGSLTSRQVPQPIGTTGSFAGYRKQTFVNENTLSFNKVFNAIHDLAILAGASYNSDKLSNVTLASTGGYGSSVITTLNSASAVTGNTLETRNVLLSYFGRMQYNYDGKYLLAASLRRDGSSRFGANTKWGVFPSASAGWRVSDEKFFRNVKVVNDLKLRASWGKSGNYNIGDYSSIPVLGGYNYTFGNTGVFGQSPAGIINPDLSWEKSETWDFGFDIGFLKNRITSSFDYYNKLSTDLLLNVPIPANTGFPTVLTNAGKVRNQGWEFELTSRNFTGDFQWTTSVNLSHNTNKVVELAGGQSQIMIPSSFDISHSILRVGEPMYSIYVVKQIGILSKDDISKKVATFGNESEGDPKYMDANADGTIDANDRIIVGHPTPDYIWGFKNDFKYKGFDLEVLVQGQSGGSIYSLLGRSLNRTGMAFADNTLVSYENRWRSAENPGNGSVGKAYSTFGRIVNTDWLYASDYLRVRNITLGYDLGKKFKSKIIQAARVYITAENFFGWDKYTGGFNPESTNTDLSGSTLFPEAGDYGGLPLSKSLIIGLNITF